VNKQQIMLGSAGVLLLAALFIFGTNVTPKDKNAMAPMANTAKSAFNIEATITKAHEKLSVEQAAWVANVESSVSRGAVKEQQVKEYTQLANFWKDSAHQHELYVFYISKAAKLVNSEKYLTFAARQILNDLRNEQEPAIRGWKAEQAIALFDKAIEINPANDSLKVEQASCYVFGKGMAGDAQETMKGIQQLLQVVRRDSANMQAQLVLGIGGVVSTQYDKAIARLQTVLKNEPGNIEAISWLAEAYAGKGDKTNAIVWYEKSRRLINNPAFSKEVDERIKQLK
jgi:tetratricopeptide (TPR) repeat protein